MQCFFAIPNREMLVQAEPTRAHIFCVLRFMMVDIALVRSAQIQFSQIEYICERPEGNKNFASGQTYGRKEVANDTTTAQVFY